MMVKTRAGRVAVEQRGSGAPVLLLHANPGDHRDFDAVVPALAARYRTLAVDWPGYGESAPLPSPRSASAMLMAEVLEDLVDRLGLAPAILVGNSIGGYAAARLAIDRPRKVRALVLVDTGGFTPYHILKRLFCRFKGKDFITRRIAGRYAEFYLKRRNRVVEQIIARTYAGQSDPARVAVDAAMWRSFLDPDHDLRGRAARITAPTLLVWGREDPVLPIGVDAQTALRCIPGSRLVALDTGHEPFAEDPEAFLAAVMPFLEEAARPARSPRMTG
ncbi:MAG TPA: alpha/beta hydrolase [Candidatus Manganitrophaceae bacterium]|nr:alpha/beta hydrolase [Candidatus Manganitrophaceae bacterium]